MNSDIIIIGGGAAGAMAGVYASRYGSSVIIFDQMEK